MKIMNLCSITSGSSGNCIYVGSDHTHIMVDAGSSGKRIEQGMNQIDLTIKEIDAVLITHEHSDHVKGLGVIARKYGIPIYATEGTIRAIRLSSSVGKIPEELFIPITPDNQYQIKDIIIKPFSVSHDAADPVAYRFEKENEAVGIATDLGKYDEYTVDKLQGLDVLLLEANHDIRMLEVGSYPYYLKQRILGDQGHLSNESAGKLLCRLLHDKMKAVLLGHLSQENNYAELAYETVRLEIDAGDNAYHADDFPIAVAGRNENSRLITV